MVDISRSYRFVSDAELATLSQRIRTGSLRNLTSLNLACCFNDGPAMHELCAALAHDQDEEGAPPPAPPPITDNDDAARTAACPPPSPPPPPSASRLVAPALANLNLAGADMDISHAALAIQPSLSLVTVDLSAKSNTHHRFHSRECCQSQLL